MVASLRRGGSAVVALMLAKGAAVNVTGGFGVTALSLAASVGDAESVKLLLAKGADPEAPDRSGATPVNRASYGKGVEADRLPIQA